MTRPACSLRQFAAAAVLILAALSAAPEATAATPPTSEPTPPVTAPAAPDAVIVYIDRLERLERRVNDLQREWLDDQAGIVDWWLAATAIFLTMLGFVVPVVASIIGYIGVRHSRKIEADARRSVETARSLVEDIREKHDQADSLLKGMTAERAAEDPTRASEAARSVQADRAASRIDQAVAAAVLLQRQGKAQEAVGKWRTIAELMEGVDDELAARAWFSVGYFCQKGGKDGLREAVNAYDRALRLKPDMADAWNNRGAAKYTLGRHEEAIADCDWAIRLQPSMSEAWNNRGNAKHALGHHEEAIADYDQAIRLKPDDAEAWNNRGLAKHALGHHEEAIADHDEAIRLKPDYAEAWNNRGAAKHALGHHEEAIADCNEALRLKPDSAKNYANRALAKLDLGDKDAARQDFETALDLARKAGDEALVGKIEGNLKALRDGEGS